MHYISGIFDAEGYISINSKGGFRIAVEISNNQIPTMLKQTFGGVIIQRKRDKKKQTLHWVISSNEECLNFIQHILPISIIKRQQLLLLSQYLQHSREERSKIRKYFMSSIAECKIPSQRNIRYVRTKTNKIPNEEFYKWFAGFADGDGNFVLYENTKRFDIQLAVFNVFFEPIKEIKSHLEGSVCLLNRKPNPLWKFTASNLAELCPKIFPYLQIKKIPCEIFINFMKTRKPWSHSEDYRSYVRDLIIQLKSSNAN